MATVQHPPVEGMKRRATTRGSASAQPFQVLTAQPRGFCAGVSRAIETVEQALALHGSPVYVLHEIVHNATVVADLAAQGAVFVDSLDDIPKGAVTVFSAHGVSNAVSNAAHGRALDIIDATCPLVQKVHIQLRRYERLGYELVLIGHAEHQEVVGTVGSVERHVHVVATVEDVTALTIPADAKVAYVTQTTLGLDDTAAVIEALVARFSHLVGPEFDDICYATMNRQNAVRAMAPNVDLFLVVGANNSSNSNRLREVAAQAGVQAYLVPDASHLDPSWLQGATRVGVTAGASAPERLVTELCEQLVKLGARMVVEVPGVRENTTFRLPSKLVAVSQRFSSLDGASPVPALP